MSIYSLRFYVGFKVCGSEVRMWVDVGFRVLGFQILGLGYRVESLGSVLAEE